MAPMSRSPLSTRIKMTPRPAPVSSVSSAAGNTRTFPSAVAAAEEPHAAGAGDEPAGCRTCARRRFAVSLGGYDRRRDDALAVLEVQQRLDRLAIAGGRRDVADLHHVGDAEVGEQRQVAARIAA